MKADLPGRGSRALTEDERAWLAARLVKRSRLSAEIPRRSDDGPAPATPAQERLFALWRAFPGQS